MPKPDALHGDGINFAFFDLLWNKCATAQQPSSSDKPSPILRVPDTVLFLFGLPHQWYFTSKNGGPHKDKTAILRKRKANLTLENIEEVFLTKASSSRGGIGDDDVVAYFISSKTETADVDLNASLDACDAVVDSEMSCNIDYFNKEGLRDFLNHGRHNKSGILQRFIAPHGGTHNSCIRAVWTPKMCILERRQTKQALHDKRFALYERAITFDGPDVHSISLPLRGTVLAGRLENICDEIVKHIADVSDKSNKVDLGVGRMVVNFKVDGNGKIWILWSDSIRLENRINDGTSDGIALASTATQPLNMNTVVKLPPAVKLTQVPSHDAKVKLDNELCSVTCPSCGKRDTNFHKVAYKTVICHFDKTIEMLSSRSESHPSKKWPPEDRFIRAAGGVGFGTAAKQRSKEALIIPPVLRQVHPKLLVKGYQMYRNDPLFLQKSCDICEDCFLAYAELQQSSFLMVYPVDPYSNDQEFCFQIPVDQTKSRANNAPKRKSGQRSNNSLVSIEKFDFKDFGKAPDMPPAILEPPQSPSALKPSDEIVQTQEKKIELKDYLDLAYTEKDLEHMIDLNKKLSSVPNPKAPSNPYKEDLTRLC